MSDKDGELVLGQMSQASYRQAVEAIRLQSQRPHPSFSPPLSDGHAGMSDGAMEQWMRHLSPKAIVELNLAARLDRIDQNISALTATVGLILQLWQDQSRMPTAEPDQDAHNAMRSIDKVRR